MIFGFDIDGVLTDDDNGNQNLWVVEACKYFDKQPIKHSFYIHEAVGVSRSEIEKFFQAKGEEILANVPIRTGCKPILQELKNAGYTVFLITARDYGYKQVTIDWLAKHEIPYDQLYMNPHRDKFFSKGKLCRELGVEFFVDDSYENCLDLNRVGVYTLMYYTTHNKTNKAPVPVVYGWDDVQQHIIKYLNLPQRKQA